MAKYELDITGKVCPYCVLFVNKKMDSLKSGDILEVKCDHPPAAMENIPNAMKKAGNKIERETISSGLWNLTITKK